MTPTRHDLALLSYREVLDATKHQDDKIGRLLGAVAFLTGGALVFADPDVLAQAYRMDGRDYPLAAIFLGAFLVVDLLAVVLWLIAMSAPLTDPGTRDHSYTFFRLIARDTSWATRWELGTDSPHDPKGLEERVALDLVDEARNLAGRASRKYEVSRVASAVFLAAILLLLPTLVLSLDTVRREEPTAVVSPPEPPPWDQIRRALVGGSAAALVLVPAVHRHWRRRATGGPGVGRLVRFAFSVAPAPALVLMAVVADGDRPFLLSGGPAVVVLGATASFVLCRVFPRRDHAPPWGAIAAGAVLLCTVGIAVAVAVDVPELQLLLAIVAAGAVVLAELLLDAAAFSWRSARSNGATGGGGPAPGEAAAASGASGAGRSPPPVAATSP